MDVREKEFVERMESLSRSEFETVVRYTLRKVLGDTPSEVMLMTLSGRALREPRVFVKALTELFGSGAQAVYLSIESYTDEALGRQREAMSREDPYSILAGAIERSGSQVRTEPEVRQPLHDHRVKDEFDEYASDAD